jgi:hypothetical protein
MHVDSVVVIDEFDFLKRKDDDGRDDDGRDDDGRDEEEEEEDEENNFRFEVVAICRDFTFPRNSSKRMK